MRNGSLYRCHSRDSGRFKTCSIKHPLLFYHTWLPQRNSFLFLLLRRKPIVWWQSVVRCDTGYGCRLRWRHINSARGTNQVSTKSKFWNESSREQKKKGKKNKIRFLILSKSSTFPQNQEWCLLSVFGINDFWMLWFRIPFQLWFICLMFDWSVCSVVTFAMFFNCLLGWVLWIASDAVASIDTYMMSKWDNIVLQKGVSGKELANVWKEI